MRHTATMPTAQAIIDALRPAPSFFVWKQLQIDVHAFMRAGAMDSAECEQAAVEAFRQLRKLTARQAEHVWMSITAPSADVRPLTTPEMWDSLASVTMPSSLRNS